MKFPTKYDHFGYNWLQEIPQGFHPGIDYNYGSAREDEGQDVIAISDGRVTYAKMNSGWGWHVIIHHPKHQVYSHYAHLHSFCVKENDNVLEGQLIGFLGGTGGNWDPHLHFEIRLKDINPNKYITGMSRAEVETVYANPDAWIKERMLQENGKQEIVNDTIQISNDRIAERLKGRILLQVQEHGEAWYVNPVDGKRYYLKDGESAYQIMKKLGLGITNEDINKIREGTI